MKLTPYACAVLAFALAACDPAPPPRMPMPAIAVPDMAATLRAYDGDVIAALSALADSQRSAEDREALSRGTTLSAPARQADLDALAARIGKPLPPSYRDFLASSDGMIFHGALNTVRLHAAKDVVRLTRENYPGLEVWLTMPDVAVPLDPSAGGPWPGPAMARAWVISSNEDLDIYLLIPDLAGPDGEWPVWFFGPKNPGAIGYPSFGTMLMRERAAALEELAARARR